MSYYHKASCLLKMNKVIEQHMMDIKHNHSTYWKLPTKDWVNAS